MLNQILDQIKVELKQRIEEKYVGNISFQVNFSPDGIANMNIETKRSFKPNLKKEGG